MNTPEARSLADLRGAAARAASRRSIRRAFRRRDRHHSRAARHEASLRILRPRLANAIAEHEATAAPFAFADPPLISPRIANRLSVALTLPESALCATALSAYAFPAFALLLGAGIATALVLIGKRIGYELATSYRLRDQASRWATLVGLAVLVITIAAVGLTLLRMGSTWAWPLLALAAPAGSAMVTWSSHEPSALSRHRADVARRRAERRVRRADRRRIARSNAARRHDAAARARYRAALGPALRRVIVDGSPLASTLASQRHLLDTLLGDHLPPELVEHSGSEQQVLTIPFAPPRRVA
jgi:hypothetical protein